MSNLHLLPIGFSFVLRNHQKQYIFSLLLRDHSDSYLSDDYQILHAKHTQQFHPFFYDLVSRLITHPSCLSLNLFQLIKNHTQYYR